MWWDAIRSAIRVDQGPDEGLKVIHLEVRCHLVDPVLNENIAILSVVPNDRLPFGKTPT